MTELKERLGRALPFTEFRAAARDVVLDALECETVLEGQVIYGQHHEDAYVYYLVEGAVQLLSDGAPVRRLRADEPLARRPLDSGRVKRHTVKALQGSRYVRLPRDIIERVAPEAFAAPHRFFEVSEVAAQAPGNWMMRTLRSGLFASLKSEAVQAVFQRMHREHVVAGDVICREGEPGHDFFVIERGCCEVVRSAGGPRPVQLADLGVGQVFGEEALITRHTRSATVTMLTDGSIMRLDERDFDELIRPQLIRPVVAVEAQVLVGAGDAVWLDVRPAERRLLAPLEGAESLPMADLRQKVTRLDRARLYIIAADTKAESELAAFVLASHGYSARPLKFSDDAGHPLFAQPPRAGEVAMAETPPAGPAPDNEGDDMADDKLTITRLSRMYGDDEATRDIEEQPPRDTFTDTATGRSLSDLIDEMNARREALNSTLGSLKVELTSPPSPPEVIHAVGEADDTLFDPLDIGADTPFIDDESGSDELSLIVEDFENRLRAYFSRVEGSQREALEAEHAAEVEALKRRAAEKVRAKAVEIQQHYRQRYAEREKTLKLHYKKLMGLASKISQQKVQIARAREEFEEKLEAANALHREVAEMRETLKKHLASIQKESGDEDGRAAS